MFWFSENRYNINYTKIYEWWKEFITVNELEKIFHMLSPIILIMVR